MAQINLGMGSLAISKWKSFFNCSYYEEKNRRFYLAKGVRFFQFIWCALHNVYNTIDEREFYGTLETPPPSSICEVG